ncbi:glycerol-3-phosphate dehydrogenase [Flavobacteriaceae bacterium MAR_2010_188]|nr:glycerol-3-phosphate dehydrogenase [Flavobacteriaceae bacterium MAR_2010_188]
MNLYNRERQIEQLKSTLVWDVVIIGGGATGLGIALDSATRGYKTLLLEQVDFAKGTSSRSTKLVHGGVRYLAQGHIDLVKEALKERGRLLKNAAHLVRVQSFIIPNYKWFDNVFYNVGLKAYDLLAFRLSFGKSERINREETLKRIETIEEHDLVGGVVYYDGQFDDSRLAINIAQTAIDYGAVVLNHFQVEGLIKDEKDNISGLTARDGETNEVKTITSKVVINATGVFTDGIIKMDDPKLHVTVRPSQGIHLVLDKSFLPGDDAIMIPKTSDGRVLFLVPWQGKVLVGTTDTLLDSHSLEPKPLEKEIEFILNTANQYLSKDVSRSDVLSMFAGLRPLAAPQDEDEKTKEISRSHKIIVSDSRLLSVIGGKWTTYRRMAQDAIDKAIELEMLVDSKCKTKKLPIHGCTDESSTFESLNRYGSDSKEMEKMISENPELGEKIHPNHIFLNVEIYWAIKFEMARTVEDILARRIRLLFLDAKAAVEVSTEIARIMAKELGWNHEKEQKEINGFEQLAAQYMLQ